MQDIILASGSPRRRDLLSQMGLSFKTIPSDFNEYLDDNRPVDEIAKELALGKARAVAERHPDALVIGSDTIVTLNGRQLGKPADEAEARQLLREHDDQTVTVTTSVVLVCKATDLELAEADTSHVAFKPYDEAATEAYLATGDWHDKAGAWGIQSGAAPLIDHIKGEYDTIIGLPTKILARMLASQGVEANALELEPPIPSR
jgi:septum formation protein